MKVLKTIPELGILRLQKIILKLLNDHEADYYNFSYLFSLYLRQLLDNFVDILQVFRFEFLTILILENFSHEHVAKQGIELQTEVL